MTVAELRKYLAWFDDDATVLVEPLDGDCALVGPSAPMNYHLHMIEGPVPLGGGSNIFAAEWKDVPGIIEEYDWNPDGSKPTTDQFRCVPLIRFDPTYAKETLDDILGGDDEDDLTDDTEEEGEDIYTDEDVTEVLRKVGQLKDV